MDVKSFELIKRLPKDELDDFWKNLAGFVPSIIFLAAGVAPYFANKTSLSTEFMLITLTLSVILFVYTVYAKLTERNLKFIRTNLSKEHNDGLIIKLAQAENWLPLSNKDGIRSFFLPFIMDNDGFKLTLISIDQGILFNIRNRGSWRGRMPYSFGAETIKGKKIKDRIKRLTQNQANKPISF